MLPMSLFTAFKKLKSNKFIAIKRADKVGAVVIMNRQGYQNKCREHLINTERFQKRDNYQLPSLNSEFKAIINKNLPYDIKQSLKAKYPSLTYFYGVPKIYKHDCPLRPIISSINSVLTVKTANGSLKTTLIN